MNVRLIAASVFALLLMNSGAAPAADFVIKASGDVYMGEPNMQIKVNGFLVKNFAVGSGMRDYKFTVANARTLSIAFTNDLWERSETKDRNLRVHSVSVDGVAVSDGFVFLADGAKIFTLPKNTVTVRLRGDNYKGPALLSVKADGKLLKTIPASDAYSAVSLGFGEAQTLSVSFTNDLYEGSAAKDRNLYISDIILNGSKISGPLTFKSWWEKTFVIRKPETPVPPPPSPTPGTPPSNPPSNPVPPPQNPGTPAPPPVTAPPATGSSKPIGNGLTIFHISPSALPGEAVSIQGNFPADAKFYHLDGATASPKSLPVMTQRVNHATVLIPFENSRGVYKIWAEDAQKRSAYAAVNEARGMHFDTATVTPGGKLRIYGRNLALWGMTPRVRLKASDASSSVEATADVAQSDAYKLSLTLPGSLQPGKTYAVFVNNGMGETQMDKTVTALPAGYDHFDLRVGWAANLNFTGNVYNVKTDVRLTRKAVGDGNANDRDAIQEAINKAAADGGGIVYLPQGTYKLTSPYFEYLSMAKRVVLQGAGAGLTTLKYGYEPHADHAGIHWPAMASQSGLADLSIINVNPTPNARLSNMRGGNNQQIFMQRVRYNLAQDDWLWLANSTGLVVANSTFTQGVTSATGYHGIVMFNGVRDFVIRNNTFTYAVDGLSLNRAQDGVFENNVILRDGGARYPANVISHVLIVSFAQNVAIVKNTFKVINGPAPFSNDGETIMAEGGGNERIDEDAGVATAAGATSLTDATKRWGAMKMTPVVAIVHGKGMGQWRRIVSRTADTLTLDKPWDVVPEAGSRYAVFNWGARNWLVQDNVFEGNIQGIMLYHNASTDLAIVGNRFTNSGSIDLTSISMLRKRDDGTSYQLFVPFYDIQIKGNTVTATNGINGVMIGAHAVQHGQTRSFGTAVIGLEMRQNTLTANRVNVSSNPSIYFPEGYISEMRLEADRYVDEQIPVLLGTILENNVSNYANSSIHLNTASYNTYIGKMTLNNSPNLLSDTLVYGGSHASVGTAWIAKAPYNCDNSSQPCNRY